MLLQLMDHTPNSQAIPPTHRLYPKLVEREVEEVWGVVVVVWVGVDVVVVGVEVVVVVV